VEEAGPLTAESGGRRLGKEIKGKSQSVARQGMKKAEKREGGHPPQGGKKRMSAGQERKGDSRRRRQTEGLGRRKKRAVKSEKGGEEGE